MMTGFLKGRHLILMFLHLKKVHLEILKFVGSLIMGYKFQCHRGYRGIEENDDQFLRN